MSNDSIDLYTYDTPWTLHKSGHPRQLLCSSEGSSACSHPAHRPLTPLSLPLDPAGIGEAAARLFIKVGASRGFGLYSRLGGSGSCQLDYVN